MHDIHKDATSIGFLKDDLVYKDYNILTKFQFSDKVGAYQIITPDDMPFFLEAIEKNYLAGNLDKINQLRKLNEESNPVIFYYEFKNAK